MLSNCYLFLQYKNVIKCCRSLLRNICTRHLAQIAQKKNASQASPIRRSRDYEAPKLWKGSPGIITKQLCSTELDIRKWRHHSSAITSLPTELLGILEGERNLSELEFVRIRFFATFWRNWNWSELEFVRIGICQNWNLSELEFVRIGICQNWNLSELEFVSIGICQNWNLSELEFVRLLKRAK